MTDPPPPPPGPPDQPYSPAPPAPPGYPPPPPPYPPPGYAPPYGETTNGFAIASLVLGILGGVACFGWILALVFGYLAKSQIDASRGMQRGRGMAIAGIVLGWVWGALGIAYLVLAVILSASTS
jgi:hypothetical protein